MHRLLLATFVFAIVGTVASAAPLAVTPVPSSAFPVKPHEDVTIEWWYLNASVRTDTGHHLAVIGAFFRFGNESGQVAKDSKIRVPHSHYLIYAITDIDQGKHYTYSLGDKTTLHLLQQAAALEIERDPSSPQASALVALLNKDEFPPPTETISAQCSVVGAPFAASYGPGNSVRAISGEMNSYRLELGYGSGNGSVKLVFSGVKTPMYVNGDGNTGLRIRTDMKYVSLTRCAVSGVVDTGSGPVHVTGQGWFDHQWGDSWTTENAGWDWWGAQLDNGTDILFFRQLNLKTGQSFFPCATFEDSAGHQVTTHDIVFRPDPTSTWTSPQTGITYPLNWYVSFPEQRVTLLITPDMQGQEMPVLASGGSIWEGSCRVAATVGTKAVNGVAYMELVGYNSPAVRAKVSLTASGR